MTEQFSEMFLVGGHANSLGRAGEVLKIVLADQSRLDELYQCIFDEDAWVRMRAIDTFEKVAREHAGWIEPYVGRLLDDVAQIDQPSIHWHLAELFAELKLSDEQRARAIDLMKNHLSTTGVDWIVAVNCMKTLTQFAREGKVAASEIIPLFEIQKTHHSKAVVKKANTLIEEIA